MTVHQDLFLQAVTLAKIDAKKPKQVNLRRAISAAYYAVFHSLVYEACCTVIKGLPRDAKGNYLISHAIQNVARAFAELQEKRHLADYDLTEHFNRSEVLGMIEQAKVRTTAFTEIPSLDEKKFFLACHWAWKDLANC